MEATKNNVKGGGKYLKYYKNSILYKYVHGRVTLVSSVHQ